MKGLNNQILEVDLNQEKFTNNSISDDLSLNFLGGRGLGIKLLSERLPLKIKPLDEKNVFVEYGVKNLKGIFD